MGMIFDDIDVNDISKIKDNDKIINNLNDNEKAILRLKKEMFNNNKMDDLMLSSLSRCGFILSYGESSNGLMPVGVFVVSGFVSNDGMDLTEEEALALNGNIVFRQVELVNGDECQIIPNGSKVVIPYKSFAEAYENVKTNNHELQQFTVSDDLAVDPALVEGLNQDMASVLSVLPENTDIEDLNLKGVSLEEAGALFLNPNGDEMGYNYTIYPFESALIKRALLVYNMENVQNRPGELIEKVKYEKQNALEDQSLVPPVLPPRLEDPLPDRGLGKLRLYR